MTRPLIRLRILSIVHLLTALGLVKFWYDFFYGTAFPAEELRGLVPNFDGYAAWEEAFVYPDLILAAGFLLSAILLWRGRGQLVAATATGGLLFLGALDLSYGITSGFMAIDHAFIDGVKQAVFSALGAGLFSLAVLLWPRPELAGV